MPYEGFSTRQMQRMVGEIVNELPIDTGFSVEQQQEVYRTIPTTTTTTPSRPQTPAQFSRPQRPQPPSPSPQQRQQQQQRPQQHALIRRPIPQDIPEQEVSQRQLLPQRPQQQQQQQQYQTYRQQQSSSPLIVGATVATVAASPHRQIPQHRQSPYRQRVQDSIQQPQQQQQQPQLRPEPSQQQHQQRRQQQQQQIMPSSSPLRFRYPEPHTSLVLNDDNPNNDFSIDADFNFNVNDDVDQYNQYNQYPYNQYQQRYSPVTPPPPPHQQHQVNSSTMPIPSNTILLNHQRQSPPQQQFSPQYRYPEPQDDDDNQNLNVNGDDIDDYYKDGYDQDQELERHQLQQQQQQRQRQQQYATRTTSHRHLNHNQHQNHQTNGTNNNFNNQNRTRMLQEPPNPALLLPRFSDHAGDRSRSRNGNSNENENGIVNDIGHGMITNVGGSGGGIGGIGVMRMPLSRSVRPPDIHSHPDRCPPLNLEFLWKLYHQRNPHIGQLNLNPILNNNNNNNNNNETRAGRRRRLIRNEKDIITLNAQGFPNGLAHLILQNCMDQPIRIWLIDNCGTMHKNDGHMVTQSSKGKVQVINCTRWEEITSTLTWHAELAAWQQTPMAVRLLQDPGAQVGPQQLGVSASKHYNSMEEVARLKALLHKTRPVGATSPINLHFQELLTSITTLVPMLEETQTKITLCICTDSIPTDADGNEHPEMMQEFITTLRQMVGNNWPIQIVWRLSTDEERVVQFYRSLQISESFPSLPSSSPSSPSSPRNTNNNGNNTNDTKQTYRMMMVLDDYISECHHVHEHNPWLNYGYTLHLCREEGIYIPLLEALRERPIHIFELRELIKILFFGDDNNNNNNNNNEGEDDNHKKLFACPETDYPSFRKQLEQLNKDMGVLWNPIRKKYVPWIDLKKLDKKMSNEINNGTTTTGFRDSGGSSGGGGSKNKWWW